MPRDRSQPGLSHLRVVVDDAFYLGPGRADLLELIGALGSISAAGKALGMSYKRAWSLIQALNTGFGAPLVETERGGAGQGGAHLTEAGVAVLAGYRRMEAQAQQAIRDDLEILQTLKRDIATGT